MPKKHRQGGKFSGKHTTLIDAAEVAVDTADKHPPVSKIILGFIKAVTSSKPRLKFNPIPAGWEVDVCGRAYAQKVYIYTADAPATKEVVEHAFREAYAG